jgi:hypothetical protein
VCVHLKMTVRLNGCSQQSVPPMRPGNAL